MQDVFAERVINARYHKSQFGLRRRYDTEEAQAKQNTTAQ